MEEDQHLSPRNKDTEIIWAVRNLLQNALQTFKLKRKSFNKLNIKFKAKKLIIALICETSTT